jgi:imidazolonepropionase-like amidohydrolase
MAEGLLVPAFCDSHVHLGLVDQSQLVANGIGRVLDLGWDPAIASTWGEHIDTNLEVDIAGPLLAAAGGYPLGSGWAPDAAVREIADAEAAAAAIAELHRLGARVAKITLNSEAGPVWGDDLLEAVVALAHARDLPVVAHAQGAGQAERALSAGVDCLAHTPWTETLSDDVIGRMVAAMSWISTLDIHGWGSYGADFTRAMGNLERFAAWGGTVHYGTDLGNGPLPVGLNRRELVALADAGLGASALVASLRGLLPVPAGSRIASFIPGAQNISDIRDVDDLTQAVVVTLSDGEDAPA